MEKYDINKYIFVERNLEAHLKYQMDINLKLLYFLNWKRGIWINK